MRDLVRTDPVADRPVIGHHEGMVWLWLALVVVGVALGLMLWRRQRAPSQTSTGTRPAGGRPRPAMEGPFLGPTATIRLDVAVGDPESPSAQRLVAGATGRVFRTSPDVTEVIVEDRTGSVLAQVPRDAPTPGPPPTRPEAETRAARPHGSWGQPSFVPSVDQDVSVGRRPLAERLDLPDRVASRVRRPDDAVDLVRAILEAAGRELVVQGTLVRSGDDVVIVVEDTAADASTALSQAFLRFRESRARRGVVIHIGYVDPREVARRRALAPELHHAGAAVLQSMADAVALGGDPVEFALADVVA